MSTGYEYDVMVGEGKYRVVAETGMQSFRALRHGKEWRDLTGDGMVLALVQEIDQMRSALEESERRFLRIKENDGDIEGLYDDCDAGLAAIKSALHKGA